MTFTVHFKTPDVLDYAMEGMTEEQKKVAQEVAKEWITHGECVTIVINTKKKTAIVVPTTGSFTW